MTNYVQLFQIQMQDPQFVKTYYEACVERFVDQMLDTLKDKIIQNEPKESLFRVIEPFQLKIHPTVDQGSHSG